MVVGGQVTSNTYETSQLSFDSHQHVKSIWNAKNSAVLHFGLFPLFLLQQLGSVVRQTAHV